MRQLRLLLRCMQGNRMLYAGAVLAIGAATCLGLLGPLVLRTTIDSIIGEQPLMESLNWITLSIGSLGGRSVLARNLWICGLALVLLSLAEGVFLFLKGKCSAIAAESTAKNLRERLYDRLQHAGYDYHIQAETGDLIQRCTSDVDTIRQFLAVQFVEVGRALFMVAAIVPVMLLLDRRMTLVATLFVPVIFGFAFFFFLKMKQVFQSSDEAEGKMSAVLQENLSGVRVVRAFARQRFEIDKFDQTNADYRDKTYRLIRLLAWYWLMASFLGMAQVCAVLIGGAYFASLGVLSLGTVVVFLSYAQMLIWPVREMGRILTDMGKAMVALGRIEEILELERETDEEEVQQPEIRGELEFRNVSFAYGTGQDVLKDVSFKVKPGQVVAILGPTGSGKTSLMHLLTRLYDYQSGSIAIDGIELKQIDKKWLRKHVGLVLQEPFLFSKSMKENIRLARSSAGDIEVFEAARMAAMHDVILDFEQGYDTAVGEKGVTLSGGQKQRVAIARTLLRNCPIVIFDDSLSAVDTETDAAIRLALRRENRATTFMISHRLTTLAGADLILVLDEGTLVQAGTHGELLRQDGLYRKVWSIQNSLEDEMKRKIA
ncbi:MAG: ABC transporter ATP-binding protein [bacterium]|nr:ABC transporter ATP-binding protein [bacterium]